MLFVKAVSVNKKKAFPGMRGEALFCGEAWGQWGFFQASCEIQG